MSAAPQVAEVRPSRPTAVQLAKMEQAARVASNRYRGSVLEQQEREQIAWLELLKARLTFDPSHGVDFFPYCLRVATLALRRANIEARSPVSGCKHRVERMRAVRGVEHDETVHVATHDRADQYEQLEEAAYCNRIRRRVRKLVGRDAEAFTYALATKDFSSKEIAAHNGMAVSRVYEINRAIRSVLSDDQELFDLWKERIK